MKKLLPVLALAAACIAPAWCLEPTDQPAPAAVARSGKPKKTKEAKEAKAAVSPLSFRLSMTHVYDTNIEQDSSNVRSVGYIPYFRLRYRDKPRPGTVTVDYEIARHSYTHSTTWDRTSQTFAGSLVRRIAPRWNTETIGEAALKGSSEDREIRDEYSAVQRLEYVLSKPHRVRVDAAWRKRHYEAEPDKNSQDPYYGVNFATLWRGAGSWILGYRRDRNSADNARWTYVRATYSTDLTLPIGRRDALLLEAKYRLLRYPHRFLRINGVSVPRHDQRWILDAAWEHDLDKTMKLSVDYRLETRRSNDTRREFDDHIVGTTVSYRW